jgi:hypothetical protein
MTNKQKRLIERLKQRRKAERQNKIDEMLDRQLQQGQREHKFFRNSVGAMYADLCREELAELRRKKP